MPNWIDFSAGYPQFGIGESPIRMTPIGPQFSPPVTIPFGGARPQPPAPAIAAPAPAAIAEPPNDPTLPVPQFGIASSGPSSFDRLRDHLNGPMTGGASTRGVAAAPPSWDRQREMLGADIGGRRVALPQIFNAGVEQAPNASFAPPGGPQVFNGGVEQPSLSRQLYDASRVAGNPQEIAALRHAIIGRHNTNVDLQNEQRNMGSGMFSVPRAEVVGRYGVNPAQPAGVAGMGAATDRLRADTEAQQQRDRLPSAVIMNGGSAQDAADAVGALRTATSGGAAESADPLRSTLDRFLQSAANIAPQQGSGPRVPVALPASMQRPAAHQAITNFVSSLASDGKLTPENLPAIMSYMTRTMRPENVDSWLAERFGGLLSGNGMPGHREAVQRMQDVMNQRGANVGNTGRSFRIGGPVGALGQSIRETLGGIFGQ